MKVRDEDDTFQILGDLPEDGWTDQDLFSTFT